MRISFSQAIQSSSSYLYMYMDYRVPVIAIQGPDKSYQIESHNCKRSKPVTIPTTPKFFAHSQNDTTPLHLFDAPAASQAPWPRYSVFFNVLINGADNQRQTSTAAFTA